MRPMCKIETLIVDVEQSVPNLLCKRLSGGSHAGDIEWILKVLRKI